MAETLTNLYIHYQDLTEISCIRCFCVFIYIIPVGECNSPSALLNAWQRN